MKTRIYFAAIAIFIAISFPLVSLGQKQIESQNNGWIWYIGNHRINEKWGIHTEYGWRRNDVMKNWMQSLIRVAGDYYLKAGPVISAGYAFVDTYEYGVQPFDFRFIEHRVFQQFGSSQQFGRFYTNNRFRLEQRWLENKALNDGGEFIRDQNDPFIFRNRVRYRFMVNIPLTRSKMENNTLFLSVANEIFVNSGREIKLNALDQNRLYAALGWRIDKDKNIQIGYLNQYVIKSDAKKAERNHTLQIGIIWGIDFRKMEVATDAIPEKK